MPYRVFRRQVAVNKAGQLVPSGAFQFVALNGTTPIPVYTSFTETVAGDGTVTVSVSGSSTSTVTVTDYASMEFAADAEEGYAKSGTAPMIHLVSFTGLVNDARVASAAAVAANAAIATGLADRVRVRGPYAAGASYAVNDLFTVGTTTYLTTTAFTASSTAPTGATSNFQVIGSSSSGGALPASYPAEWPSTFPPSSHSHLTSDLRRGTNLALIADVLAFLAAGDRASALAALTTIGVGTGTSNLQLGTTATTAAPGNHTHGTTYTTPAVVQQMINDSLAASGGTGGGDDDLEVIYANGAYPAQPVSAPAGIKTRRFIGPVAYTGPAWAGVVDLWTYADLA